jgi:hypothetical protein
MGSGVVRRCTLVVPDSGPFNSLWVAGELDLFLKLDMPVVVVDAVQDEITSDPDHFLKDREVQSFLRSHRPPFIEAATDVWQFEKARRARGQKPKRNAGELAIQDYLSSEDGLKKQVKTGDPVVLLFEDRDIRLFNKPPHLHLLSTVGLLRGLELVGVLPSANDVISRMTRPTLPGRRPSDRRVFTDLPTE